MLEIYNALVSNVQQYGAIYLWLQFGYTIFYSFLLGVAKQDWNIKVLLEGFFFPISIQNEIGVLVRIIFDNKRAKAQLNESEQNSSNAPNAPNAPNNTRRKVN